MRIIRFLLVPILALGFVFASSGTASASMARSLVAYMVVDGDWLSKIAGQQCGSISRWPDIYALNRVVVGSNPNLIYAGQRLSLPSGCSGAAAPASRAAALSSGAWRSPLASYTLTSCFGWRKSTQTFHQGLDLAAPRGTLIRAAAGGIVTRTGWIWRGYGISTVIRHANGTWTHYAHQSSASVQVGQQVSAGQSIGRVGNTGFVIASRGGDGSHLHFEIATMSRVLHAQINPAPFLRQHGVPVRGCYG